MVRTRVGYAGGTKANPTYHDLGDHSEAIEIQYDPAVLGYEQLLALFWKEHDPKYTTSHRQYRAAVFPIGEHQLRLARASLPAGGLTPIEPLTTFTPAEDYHQKYYLRRERELTRTLVALHGNDRAFMDTTAAARLNAFYGHESTRDVVVKELTALGLNAADLQRVQVMLKR